MRKFEVKHDPFTITSPYSDITIIERHEDGMGDTCIADVWHSLLDAHLLAAAPELLEQLKHTVAMIEVIPYTGTAIADAKALIERLENIS
jgi:hypothetical protein